MRLKIKLMPLETLGATAKAVNCFVDGNGIVELRGGHGECELNEDEDEGTQGCEEE